MSYAAADAKLTQSIADRFLPKTNPLPDEGVLDTLRKISDARRALKAEGKEGEDALALLNEETKYWDQALKALSNVNNKKLREVYGYNLRGVAELTEALRTEHALGLKKAVIKDLADNGEQEVKDMLAGKVGAGVFA